LNVFDVKVGGNTVIDSNRKMTGVDIVPTTNFTFRNRIINGDMRIDQRNAGGSITPTDAQYSVDRWKSSLNVASKFSLQQSSTAPSGFSNSLLATSLSSYSVGAGEVTGVQQLIEGLNVADLAWGTASAKSVTLSFWVRSSLTGTFAGSLRNSASDRSYPFSYTISSVDTWEQKTLTIAGDTSGTWLTTNGRGISLYFAFGAGSTFSSTAGSWQTGNYISVTGATSLVGTSGATFYITGVQLEEGTVATPFEHRPTSVEENLCYRYYYRMTADPVTAGGTTNASYIGFAVGRAYSTTEGTAIIYLPVPLRTSPPVLNFTPVSGNNWDYSVSNIQLVNRQNADKRAIAIFANIAVAQSQSSWLLSSGNLTSSTDSVFIDFSAEL